MRGRGVPFDNPLLNEEAFACLRRSYCEFKQLRGAFVLPGRCGFRRNMTEKSMTNTRKRKASRYRVQHGDGTSGESVDAPERARMS